jgi:hypothetical protein
MLTSCLGKQWRIQNAKCFVSHPLEQYVEAGSKKNSEEGCYTYAAEDDELRWMWLLAPALVAITSGMRPRIKAMAVITTARKRIPAAVRAASNRDFPAVRCSRGVDTEAAKDGSH